MTPARRVEAAERQLRKTLDLESVRIAIDGFVDNLDSLNPTLLNVELAKHVDAIICDADGGVELRGVYLGFFQGAADFLVRSSDSGNAATATDSPYSPVVPRLRGRLNVPNLTTETGLADSLDEACLDPHRFTGLPERFFWRQRLVLADKIWPGKAKAEDIVQMRLEHVTHAEIARRVGLSIPTVRKILEEAEASNPELAALPQKMARARWHEDHAAEVAEAKKTKSMAQLVEHFDKSDVTIQKALKFAASLQAANPESESPPQDGAD